MPLVRVQVRNEFALGNPEVYKGADKDDPKAVLDGVAVAGLVGILRQLGDLAEYLFASGIRKRNACLVSVSEEEEERYSQAVQALEFDRHLGPYDLSHYGDWKRLSNYITISIIERLEPIGGEITVTHESAMYENCLKTAMEKALDEQLRNNKFTDNTGKFQKSGCYYTSIPRVVKCKGIQGRQLTSLNLDKTDLLETLLEIEYGGSEEAVLGEMQFAFVAFLMGQSIEAFIQWKSLVSLLFGCIEAVNKSVGPFDALFCVVNSSPTRRNAWMSSRNTSKAGQNFHFRLISSVIMALELLKFYWLLRGTRRI